MDGGKRSYDKPPTNQGESTSATDQSSLDPSVPQPQVSPAPHPAPAASIAPIPGHAPPSTRQEGAEVQASIPTVEATIDAMENHAHVGDPIPVSAGRMTSPEVDLPRSGAGNDEGEAMSRPLKIAYAFVLGVLALSLLGLAYVHLHHSDDGHSTRAASPTTTTTLTQGTTTTTLVPKTLSSSAEAAATALVSSWSTNNRSEALTVATPSAVATLFSVPYASGLAISRGCSTSFSPIVCTFGPPGGASPTDPIYEIMVSQVVGGWYVSSVKIENLTRWAEVVRQISTRVRHGDS